MGSYQSLMGGPLFVDRRYGHVAAVYDLVLPPYDLVVSLYELVPPRYGHVPARYESVHGCNDLVPARYGHVQTWYDHVQRRYVPVARSNEADGAALDHGVARNEGVGSRYFFKNGS